MSAPLPEDTIHLVAADEALSEHYWYRNYPALCGEILPTSNLPSCLCAPECTSHHPYCPACLRVAVRYNAEVEQDARVIR